MDKEDSVHFSHRSSRIIGHASPSIAGANCSSEIDKKFIVLCSAIPFGDTIRVKGMS